VVGIYEQIGDEPHDLGKALEDFALPA